LLCAQQRAASPGFYTTALQLLDADLDEGQVEFVQGIGAEKIEVVSGNGHIVDMQWSQDDLYVGVNFRGRIGYAVHSLQEWQWLNLRRNAFPLQYGVLVDLCQHAISGGLVELVDRHQGGVEFFQLMSRSKDFLGMIFEGYLIREVQKVGHHQGEGIYVAGLSETDQWGLRRGIHLLCPDEDQADGYRVVSSKNLAPGVARGLDVVGGDVVMAYDPFAKRNRSTITTYRANTLEQTRKVRLNKHERFGAVTTNERGNMVTIIYDSEQPKAERSIVEWDTELNRVREYVLNLPPLRAMLISKKTVYMARNHHVYKFPNLL